MEFGKQLLVTLVENGATALLARYALVRGGKVLSGGECSPMDLPYAPEARAAFFSPSGYFDRAEAEVRNTRTLPFQAHRIIERAIVFNEPFRVRYAATNVGESRYRLDLAAAADADIHAALETLPAAKIPFSRLVLAETAIASLVGMVTDEPAGVLWMRDGVVIGALVEKGTVLARSMDNSVAGGGDRISFGSVDPRASIERVFATVSAAANRMFPGRQLPMALALGELAGKSTRTNDPARALEDQLIGLFTGARENSVLQWPELYGLAGAPACYSLLEPDYQEEARVSRYASWTGAALLACGMAGAAAASWEYFNWHRAQSAFASRNAKLDAEYASVRNRLPSPAQRLHQPSGETVFRLDIFLAWVSRITPRGALIRHLHVAPKAAARNAPEGSAGSAKPMLVTIEWDVPGNYAEVEKQVAGLLLALGARTTPSGNKLEYQPGGNARFTTVLSPLAGAFKE